MSDQLSKTCTAFQIQKRFTVTGTGARAAFGVDVGWPQGEVLFIGFEQSYPSSSEFSRSVAVSYVQDTILSEFSHLVNLPLAFVPDGWGSGQRMKANLIELQKVHKTPSAVAAAIAKTANDKTRYPNIRIAFNPGGAWSQLGTGALNTDVSTATMNLEWLDAPLSKNAFPGDDFGVIKHEFGHALGLVHEHNRADIDMRADGIELDTEAIYKLMKIKDPTWDKATIDANVIQTINVDSQNASDYDPLSIMHYRLDCNMFKNKKGPQKLGCTLYSCDSSTDGILCAQTRSDQQKFNMNNTQFLSPMDKSTIKRKYSSANISRDFLLKLFQEMYPGRNIDNWSMDIPSDEESIKRSIGKSVVTISASVTDEANIQMGPITPDDSEQPSTTKLSIGAIIGITVSAVVVVVGLISLVIFLNRKKKLSK